MRIVSDFRDYYDWACDGTGPILYRNSENYGPSKPEQLAILNRAGIQTPPHGKVEDVIDHWWEQEGYWIRRVVAYTDINTHRGEGKELWKHRSHPLKLEPRMGYDANNEKARANHAVYCSALVQGHDWSALRSRSLRLLQIGQKRFWIEYTSNTSWMSNVGEGDCEVVDYELVTAKHPGLSNYPLYAIDFVQGLAGKYAVDLNLSPQIRGTGVEKLLKAEDLVSELEKWFR